MHWPCQISRRIRMLLDRDHFTRDLREEMQLHLELKREQQIERGLSATDAYRTAHQQFGDPIRIEEKSLMTWGSEWSRV